MADFARGLKSLGIEIISTGGTARVIQEAGVPAREVSDVTGFPEMLDGRLKTINPRIAGGILAMRSNTDHMQALERHGIPAIDMVVVNLYPFEKVAAQAGASLEELIENIDIGGPTLLRAAAKNYQDVAVVTSPQDYGPLLDEMRAGHCELGRETLWRLALQAFATTAAYDRAISARLRQIGAGAAAATGDPRHPRRPRNRSPLRREPPSIRRPLFEPPRRDRWSAATPWQGTVL